MKNINIFILFLLYCTNIFTINFEQILSAIRQQDTNIVLEELIQEDLSEDEDEKAENEKQLTEEYFLGSIQKVIDSGIDLHATLKINGFTIRKVDLLFSLIIMSPISLSLTLHLLDVLLKHGANVNTQGPIENTRYENNTLVSHSIKYVPLISLVIDDYADEADLEKFFYLFNNGANINALDTNGETTLMYVIENHFLKDDKALELIKHLINNGASLQLQNNDGKTALDLAKEFNKIEVIKTLESLL